MGPPKIGFVNPSMSWYIEKEYSGPILKGKCNTEYGAFTTEFGTEDSYVTFEPFYPNGKVRFQVIPRLRPMLSAHLEHVQPLTGNLSLRIIGKVMHKKDPTMELALEGLTKKCNIRGTELSVGCDVLYGRAIDFKWSLKLGKAQLCGTNLSNKQFTLDTDKFHAYAVMAAGKESRAGLIFNAKTSTYAIEAAKSHAQLRAVKNFGAVQVAADSIFERAEKTVRLADISLAASATKDSVTFGSKWTARSNEITTRIGYKWGSFEAALISKFGSKGFITGSCEIVRDASAQ